jgi:CO/xanthine dehydrogenase FAD-binding subunit
MKPAAFEYSRPDTLSEAIRLLGEADGSATPICGGQSLLVLMGLRLTMIDRLVDISRLPELRELRNGSRDAFVGASTTHAAIEDGRIPDPSAGLMARVASKIAYRAIRNLGTIGGSVALADPSADWPACLIALGAEVSIAGPDGQRWENVALGHKQGKPQERRLRRLDCGIRGGRGRRSATRGIGRDLVARLHIARGRPLCRGASHDRSGRIARGNLGGSGRVIAGCG